MAFTARLKPQVEADAKAYADRVGLSLNALLSVALRDYLDARPLTRPSGVPLAGAVAEQDAGGSRPQSPRTPKVSLTPAPAQIFSPPKSRSAPCPCGAKSPDGYPVKWKHCHGRSAA